MEIVKTAGSNRSKLQRMNNGLFQLATVAAYGLSTDWMTIGGSNVELFFFFRVHYLNVLSTSWAERFFSCAFSPGFHIFADRSEFRALLLDSTTLKQPVPYWARHRHSTCQPLWQSTWLRYRVSTWRDWPGSRNGSISSYVLLGQCLWWEKPTSPF